MTIEILLRCTLFVYETKPKEHKEIFSIKNLNSFSKKKSSHVVYLIDNEAIGLIFIV